MLRVPLHHLPRLAAYLLRDEAVSGKLIIGATVLALLVANSPLGGGYESFWRTDLSLGFGSWVLSQDLRHWVSEGLMAVFFLVVGLELKRELVRREMGSFRAASLPVAAALGGMVVPALIYLSFNAGLDSARGWAIPMATDIAFAIGVLALLGRRIPSSLRLFLLTLAIADDIGAVIVIALFYNSDFNPAMALFALSAAGMIGLLARSGHLHMAAFAGLGGLLWLLVHAAGIHASIVGVLLGLLAPLAASPAHERSLAERLERFMIPVSTLLVIPLFAFANTGIVLTAASLQHPSAWPVAGGIVVGLVVGKVVGITGASWLMVRLGLARLPSGIRWRHMAGVGLLAGIGFTVSIFVTELAFSDAQLVTAAKLGIFAASAVSAVLGYSVLRYSLVKDGVR